MKKKNLLLLCDNYPLSNGEFFIDDEMKIIAEKFNKIYILTNKPKNKQTNRSYPRNAELFFLTQNENFYSKLFSLRLLFTRKFLSELVTALTKHKIKLSFILFKVILNDLKKAIELKKTIEKITYNNANIILYSYWHDYKALAISMITNSYPNITSISRAHRWDIYFEENEFPYLPFKKFIVENLTMTYSISEDGKKTLIRTLDEKMSEKIQISKLGKSNNHQLNKSKVENSIIICSCSSLTKVKRVNQIIDILANLKSENVTWYHFGDGPLKSEIIRSADSNLTNCNFKLLGFVTNEEILNFYAENYVDLFINVSESEGIPVSIMEAQSAGIPVFATNVGGNKEIVNNLNGCIFEKNFNPTDIANQIDDYLKTEMNEILLKRINSHKNWKENYCAETNFNQFFNSLNAL